MSLYDKASLVLIPSGTKTSKVYSQKPTNGDGDFTFSRSTAATRVNASGNIEKETQNLITYSNGFNSWGQTGVSVTSGQSGYDGSSDAWLLTTNASQGRVQQTLPTTSGVYTLSCYMKQGTNTRGVIRMNQNGSEYVAYFELDSGTAASVSGNVIASAIEDKGNGWYRCSAAFITTTSSNSVGLGSAANGSNWTATTSGNIYIQDAQLEQGLVARDYIETTTTAIYGGITDNVPRLDYTDSSCPALLLEPQRTNLATQSEYFTDIFTENSGVTWESNSTTSPEGLMNASKLNNSNAGSSGAYYVPLAFTDNDTMTASIFAKEGDVSELLFGITNQNESKSLYYSFDLSAGTATYNANNGGMLNVSGSIVDYGNGWYRCIVTGTFPSSGTTSGGVFPRIPQAGYVYLYGLQVEKNGSYATSYIPTYGSAVTRNVDTYNNTTGIAGLLGSTTGTFFVDMERFNTEDRDAAGGTFELRSSNGQTELNIDIEASGSTRAFYRDGGSFNFMYQSSILRGKFCFIYNGSNLKLYHNGLNQFDSATALSANDFSQLVYTGIDGAKLHHQIMLFPTALTDQEAIDLTTI